MRDGPADVVAIGETMALLTPSTPVPLETADQLTLGIGGAESNVAMHLAGLGVRARWVSRVGEDPLGRRLVRELQDAGVDVSAVEHDPVARTGLYLKDPGRAGSTVHYYRDGSAASRMGPELLALPAIRDARVLHLSGITAALSTSCEALLHAAVIDRRARVEMVSFDVNHRPGLWSAEDAAPMLATLADASDLVFVGRDEAERLWGTATPEEVRARLPSPATVVVKDGALAAHAVSHDDIVSEPALQVDVVEPVGAGDAFAAGYLAGLLSDADASTCLRWGHLMAALVLQVVGDQAPLPPRSWFEHHAELAGTEWRYLDPRPAVG